MSYSGLSTPYIRAKLHHQKQTHLTERTNCNISDTCRARCLTTFPAFSTRTKPRFEITVARSKSSAAATLYLTKDQNEMRIGSTLFYMANRVHDIRIEIRVHTRAQPMNAEQISSRNKSRCSHVVALRRVNNSSS